MWRTLLRVVVLLTADVAAYAAVHLLVTTDRAAELADRWAFSDVWSGYLGGWQFALALVIGLAATGTYGRGDSWRDVSRIGKGVALATGLVLWRSMWISGLLVVGLQFALATAVMAAVIASERHVVEWAMFRFLPRMRTERAIMVGDPNAPKAARLDETLAGGKHVEVSGWVWYPSLNGSDTLLGSPDEIWDILKRNCPDAVIVNADLEEDLYEKVVEAASVAGCRILAAPRGTRPGKIVSHLVWYRDIPFVELSLPALKGYQLLIKRVLDVVGASLGLILSSPLFAIIGAAIKLDSRGPVFFGQERIGYGGRVFQMFKFRSMSDGADDLKGDLAHLNESGDARLFKIHKDPRVTRVGNLLRRWSLDELPQLWNVLRGDMSLVGPRPFFESDLDEYSDRHFHRLGAKPGLTGLWQVRGRSAVIDFEEVVRLDAEYIDQWSIWFDLKLMAQTFPAVVRRRGAF